MSNKTANVSRRSVLDLGAKAAATLGLSTLLGPVSKAATLERACVCIYLLGGNDSNNMFVPLDSPAYDAYARGRGSLALAASSLLPVRAPATSANYGFHPALAGLQDLYNRGVLAVVANVGRADRPLVKGQFDAGQLPKNLFEHSADPQIRYLSEGRLALPWDSAASTASVAPVGAATNPGQSLREKLGAIARELTNTGGRTTYTLTMSGFDTHKDELKTQATLFAELNEGLTSFYQQLEGIGLSDSVTVFTATEFNRTLAPNANGGTEHAWGGHRLVLGGAVRGGEVYGRFPSLQLGGPDDLQTSGIWIPTIAEDQYSSTIARWYGVADVNRSFPRLRNFAAQAGLTFLSSR